MTDGELYQKTSNAIIHMYLHCIYVKYTSGQIEHGGFVVISCWCITSFSFMYFYDAILRN